MVRQALGALGADAGQPLKLLDEFRERIGSLHQNMPGIFMPPIIPPICSDMALVGLAVGVVDGREDQVLQHLDVVFRHRLGIDLDRLQLLGAVDDDRHHAAAGGRLDASSAICFCMRSCICCACFIIC